MTNFDKYDTLLLLSGGIDSTAALHFLHKNNDVIPLFVNYGQLSAKQELTSVEKICSSYHINFTKISTSGITLIKDGLIIGRNAFLFCTALLKINEFPTVRKVCSGIHQGTSYNDCSRDFENKIQDIFDIYLDGKVRVFNPFVNWSKNDVWNYCINEGIITDNCYSCELGLEQPCGKCQSCMELNSYYVRTKK